jgi:CIC family chloride channel protein
MCGLVIAGISSFIFPMQPADQVVLAVIGMSGCLGAVVGAPVTGILIVFEMTHQFSLVPALMLGALVSQAVRRRVTKHNFYEAVLVQDGHHLQHVIPPRDLQSWHQLPVSSIANFRPVLIENMEPAELQKVLSNHPYQRFPVMQNGKVSGVLTRQQAEKAIASRTPARVDAAVTCRPNQTIRELQGMLIESTSLMVVVLDEPNGRILGLVTLHDVLRAEVNIAKDNA